MEVKKCQYCGRKYTAKTKRSKFCCDKCRVYASRGKRVWRIAAPAEFAGVSHEVPSVITENEISKAVVQLKGAAATLDSASLNGPANMRALCGNLSASVLAAVREVGL